MYVEPMCFLIWISRVRELFLATETVPCKLSFHAILAKDDMQVCDFILAL